MMGLITLEELNKRLKNDTTFYFQSNGFSDVKDIQNELSQTIDLKIHHVKEIDWSRWKWIRSLQKRKYLVDASEIKDFNAVVILGGDDLSEYYTKKIYRDLLKYWRWSLSKNIFLLGQSIGPFHYWKNKFVVKNLYKKIPIFVRDAWSKDYLASEFGLKKNVWQSADIAFLDLPLQHDKSIEKEILDRYHLQKNQYLTLVMSGLVGKYYTKNKEKYFEAYKKLIEKLQADKDFKDLKIVLLAHTFPPHADEGKLIKEFLQTLPTELKQNIIPVTDKILQTKARFILGNGRMTVTGRMHAAISTFQMGKPAIALSYSAKYKGVIGMNLNRTDLIIESDNEDLWNNLSIVDLIMEKIHYTQQNYEKITREIQEKVSEQKKLVEQTFDTIAEKINNL